MCQGWHRPHTLLAVGTWKLTASFEKPRTWTEEDAAAFEDRKGCEAGDPRYNGGAVDWDRRRRLKAAYAAAC